MYNQQGYQENSLSKRQKLQAKRQKAKQKYQKPNDQKPMSKQQIRKQKNRLAAQKSRDRKQQYFQAMQTQNRALKQIISHCQQCRAAQLHYRHTHQSLIEQNKSDQQQNQSEQHREEEEPIILSTPSPVWTNGSPFLREEDQHSSQNLSKYFWFCLVAVVICLAQAGRQDTTNAPITRLGLQINQTQLLSRNNSKDKQPSFSNSLRIIKKNSKQCMRCMECFRNMTNATNSEINALTTINQTSSNNATNSINSSNSTISKNNTNKILFCRSKATFFKKVYDALNKNYNFFSLSPNVNKVQATGKVLSQIMDKDCFSDSLLDDNQLYSVQFTLIQIKDTKIKNLSQTNPI